MVDWALLIGLLLMLGLAIVSLFGIFSVFATAEWGRRLFKGYRVRT